MYFHAGQDFLLNTKGLIGIFDLDTAGASRRTQAFFRAAEREGAVIDVCLPGAVPRSFLVMDFPQNSVYISQFSPKVLQKRAQSKTL